MKLICRLSSGLLGVGLIAAISISAQERARQSAPRTLDHYMNLEETGGQSSGVSVGVLNARLYSRVFLNEGEEPFVAIDSREVPRALSAQRLGGERAEALSSGTGGSTARHGDPCQSRMRCAFLATIMSAKDVKALNVAYGSGCHGFTEQALDALRLYQLNPAQGTGVLLDSMPRGVGDSMSFMWMTSMGTVETGGDIQYFYNAVYPFDELPKDGCYNGGLANGGKYLTEYYSSLANAVMKNPRYMPAFLAASQLFGYKKDWSDLNKDQSYCLFDINKLFTRLLLFLYTKDKKAFREYSGWTKFGKAAFDQAEDEAIRIMILKMKRQQK